MTKPSEGTVVKNVCKHGIVLHKDCTECERELFIADKDDQVCQDTSHSRGRP